MFENEIKELTNQLKEAVKVYEQHKEISAYIDKLRKENKIAYIYVNCTPRHEIYSYVIGQLRSLVKVQTGLDLSFRTYTEKGETHKELFDAAVKKVKSVKNGDITARLVEILSMRCGWEKEPRHNIKDDTITLKLNYESNLRLVINALNILIDDTIEADEVFQKCWQVLKGGQNTFVYRNIKITCYENGKIKLVFGDNEKLEKMLKLLKKIKVA